MVNTWKTERITKVKEKIVCKACQPAFVEPKIFQFTQFAYRPGGETYKTIPEIKIIINE